MAWVMRAGAACLVLLAAVASACSGGGGGVEAVASSSCTKLIYDGEGDLDAIVVSDFPLRGVGADATRDMTRAIEHVIRKRGFQAGDYGIGYQSCNDTVGDQPYDEATCKRNARAYVATEDVVGIIGPWNSGCAVEQIPIVSRSDAGPLAMISPSNTFAALTRPELVDFPGQLYPDGVRSYVRVVPHDQSQGIATAHLARRLGARRVVLLSQVDFDDEYVRGVAEPFLASAKILGLETVRFEWQPRQKNYARLAASVAAARPDAVYLAGLPQGNGKRLVEDLRSALGPGVHFVGPDSFGAADIAKGLGRAGEGMFVTVPGIPNEELPPAGQRFLKEFGVRAEDPAYLAEAAQAAEVLLDAISRSDGTRASVVEELFATKVENGILGSFAFDRFGDVVPAPVGIYRFERGKIVAESVVRVPLGALR